MASDNNISVANQANFLRDVALRSRDTMSFTLAATQALVGGGKITRGTIERRIAPNVAARYRFESDSTYVQFKGSGAYPSAILMTTYPDTLPTAFGTQWIRAGGRVNVQTHSIRIDSIQIVPDRRWTIRIPRGTLRPELADSTFVRRVYALDVIGDTTSRGTLSFRYAVSEIPLGVPEDSLQIYRLDNVTGIAGGEQTVPENYDLFQNYPNPFNPSTVIQYQLPYVSRVTLKVFNLLGQEVKTLLNEDQEAGRKSIVWNATNSVGISVGSGIYFLQMRATATKSRGESVLRVMKMVLIR